MTNPSKSTQKKMSSIYSHLSRPVVEEENDKHYHPLDHGKRSNEAGGKLVRRDQEKGVVGGEEEYGKLDCRDDREEEKSGAGGRVKNYHTVYINAKIRTF